MTTIAVVETEKEIQTIKKNRDTSAFLWIAVEPFCVPRLRQDKENFVIAEDFIGRYDIFNDVLINAEKLKKGIISRVDEWIQNHFTEFKRHSIPLLMYFNYYLTVLFDGIIFRLMVLNKICKSIRPREIVVCKNGMKQVGPEETSFEFPWNAQKSVWAHCLKCIREMSGYSVSILDCETKICGGRRGVDICRKMRRYFPYSYMTCQIAKKNGIRPASRFYLGKKVVVIDLGYQWKISEALFKKSGYHFVSIMSSQCDGLYNRDAVDYIENMGVRDLLRYAGVDFSSLVTPKLNQIISFGIRVFPAIYRKFVRVLGRIKPKAVGFSVITRPEGWLLIQAAKHAGIPIFCWGHGASGAAKYSRQMPNEVLICDYYLAQGNGSRSTYSAYEEYSGKTISVGLPTLDQLKISTQKVNTKPAYDFVYVTTNYYQNRFYLVAYPGLYDNHLFDAQTKIINFLTKTGLKTIFKIAESPLNQEPPVVQLPESIVVEKYKSFTEVLPLANAVIVDFPSTVLLESLTTAKPLFVLTRFVELNEDAERLLKKRAICCDDVEDLIAHMEAFIKKGVYNANVNNCEYLEEFGTFEDDGGSAERGVREILKRLNQHHKA